MKQTIRLNTFETNSSSTHSCVISSPEEHKKWMDGDIYVDWDGNFISKEQVEKEFKENFPDSTEDTYEEDWDEFTSSYGYFTFENWGGEYYDVDTHTKTINGQEVIVDCFYGYDG